MKWRGCLVPAFLALATLGACQGPSGYGGAFFQVGATAPPSRAQERLDVAITLGRRLLAATADISRLSVIVRDAADVEHFQTLPASAMTAGRVVASFTVLPPGPAAIEVRAYTADDRQIGKASHQMDLRPAVTNQAELTFYLEGSAPPSPGPGAAEVAIEVHDGPTIAGPPPPAVPKFKPPYVAVSTTYFEASPLLLDRSGAAWVNKKRVLPDGTLQDLGAESIKASAMNAQGLLWVHRGGKLQRLNSQVQVLRELNAPWEIGRDGLAIDASDNLWAAAGTQLRKITPSGVVAGVFDLPGEAGAIAIDKVAGTVWVNLWLQGQVARMSASGALLGLTNVNQFGDSLSDLALDSGGNAWIPQRASNRIAKVRPDGTVAGNYATPLGPHRVLVDAQDNVLVASSNDLYVYDFWKLSPNGQLVAKYEVAHVWDWAFDAAGRLWVLRAVANTHSGQLARVTL